MSRFVQGIEKCTYRVGLDYGKDSFFSIESVGKTLPCKEYLVERTRIKNDTISNYVFEYVLEGKGHIECDGEKFAVGAGDFYFLNRRYSHLYYSDGEDPYTKVWVNVGGRLLDGIVNACGFTDGAIVINHSATLPYFEQIREILQGINADNNDAKMEECAKVMCLMLLTASAERKKTMRTKTDMAERIKAYIDSGLSYNITLDDIAEHFYLSKSYIISIFSAKYGYTPKQYIIDRKIQVARSMLEENVYSIADIADVLNFSSSQHFSSSFKKNVGVSPDAYRKSALGRAETHGKE